MLKHENTPQTQVQPATQVHVTPEELAAAVTALQIRKEGQPGTIAIGDAVEELGLNATPEEVLAEVQAQRTTQKPIKERPLFWRTGGKIVFVVAFACLLAWGMWWFLEGANHRATPKPTDGRFTLTYAPTMFVEDLGDKNNPVKPFAAVPDDHAVRCSLGEMAFYSFQVDRDSWILIKHNGKVYVRAYSVLGEEAAEGHPSWMTLYNTNARFPNAAALTVPLSQLQRLPGTAILADQYSGPQIGFTAVDVHLDKYAYEKW